MEIISLIAVPKYLRGTELEGLRSSVPKLSNGSYAFGAQSGTLAQNP